MVDLETNSVTHSATVLGIVEPSGSFLGTTDFRVAGTAHVRMHSKTFIKVGGQGQTFEHHFNDGNAIKKVEIRLGNDAPKEAVLQPQGDRVRWHLDISGAVPGSQTIRVKAFAVVTETRTKTVGNNEPEVETNTKSDEEERVKQITIDDIAPNLEVTNLALSTKPPWFVSIKGTASDNNNVAKVEWHLDDSAPKLANNDSGDWLEWTATISLPNRTEPHEISIIATDRVGNFKEVVEPIAPDTKAPIIVFLQPAENPHTELWTSENSEDNPIILEVMGVAFDTETTVEKVEWRHNDGALLDAENLSSDWSSWRFVVELDRSGTHLVMVTATDVVGNSNGDNPTTLTIHVQEVL